MDAHILFTMATTLVLLVSTFVIGRIAFGALARVEGYSFSEEAFEKNNPAVIVRYCGMMTALFVAVIGSYKPAGLYLLEDVATGVAAFVGGLAALIVSRYINDYLVLRRVNNNRAVIEEQNLAVAIVEVSTYLATAFIFAGGMMDTSHGFSFNLAWFAIGQVFLVIIAFVYSKISPKIFEQVARGNPACALELAGILLSGGIAVGFAIRGSFESWTSDLTQVGQALAIWLALMVVVTAVKRFSLLGGDRLASELIDDRNWPVGLLNGLTYVAFTAAFVSIHG